MTPAIVHITSDDVALTGSYERTGDVLYLSTPDDDRWGPAQETPEGHAVRLDADGRITHITAISARWILEREQDLTATLADGRRLRIAREDVADLIG
jgi:hypothetical protein